MLLKSGVLFLAIFGRRNLANDLGFQERNSSEKDNKLIIMF
jgi:hypothetical protein